MNVTTILSIDGYLLKLVFQISMFGAEGAYKDGEDQREESRGEESAALLWESRNR